MKQIFKKITSSLNGATSNRSTIGSSLSKIIGGKPIREATCDDLYRVISNNIVIFENKDLMTKAWLLYFSRESNESYSESEKKKYFQSEEYLEKFNSLHNDAPPLSNGVLGELERERIKQREYDNVLRLNLLERAEIAKQAEIAKEERRLENIRNTVAIHKTLDYWLNLNHYSKIEDTIKFLTINCSELGFTKKPTDKQLVIKVSAWAEFDASQFKIHIDALKNSYKIEKKDAADARKIQIENNKIISEQNKLIAAQNRLIADQERAERHADYVDNMTVTMVRESLGITETELKRWKEDGRIPIKRLESFRKWGKTLTTSIHSYKIISQFTPDIITSWRSSDMASGKAKKLSVAKLNKLQQSKTKWGFEDYSPYKSSVDIKINWFGEDHSWKLAVFREKVFSSEILWYAHWKTRVVEFNEHVVEQAKVAESIIEPLIRKDGEIEFKTYILSLLKTSQPSTWNINVESHAKNYYKKLDRDRATKEILGSLTLHEYPNLFTEARKKARKFIMHVGPTNSGKTYEAYEALANAKTGAYLAPLRLLALEGRDTLAAKGVAISLITGEEQQIAEGDTHVSSTIEMANLNAWVDVAVIDEFQMLYDNGRGWAWTNAICGIPADTVYLCGSPESIPAVKRLLNLLGDSLEIRYFERKNPLEMDIGFTTFRKGDAVIAFSIKNVIAARECLKDMGFKVSTIYGALSPEVRKAEANRFVNGETDIIVSTDAIGMGLNLPVQRIVFSEISKFDGTTFRPLNQSEVMQIAGRAGRFGMHEKGLVASVDKHEEQFIKQTLSKGIPSEMFTMISVAPTINHVKFIGNGLKTKKIKEILSFFSQEVVIKSNVFKVAELKDQIIWAHVIDNKASGMSLADKFTYCHVPLNEKDDMDWFITLLSKHHNNNNLVKLPNLGINGDLHKLTTISRLLTSYIWLSFKYPEIYCDRLLAEERRLEVSNKIEKYLVDSSHKKNTKINTAIKKHALYKKCPECNDQLPLTWMHRLCDDCYSGGRDERYY